jgi:hypothetical protein
LNESKKNFSNPKFDENFHQIQNLTKNFSNPAAGAIATSASETACSTDYVVVRHGQTYAKFNSLYIKYPREAMAFPVNNRSAFCSKQQFLLF